jgi:hypothetical protein
MGHQIGYLMGIEVAAVQTVAFLAGCILGFARFLVFPLLSAALLAAVDAAQGRVVTLDGPGAARIARGRYAAAPAL